MVVRARVIRGLVARLLAVPCVEAETLSAFRPTVEIAVLLLEDGAADITVVAAVFLTVEAKLRFVGLGVAATAAVMPPTALPTAAAPLAGVVRRGDC